jgi:hypothetical protein
MGEDESMCHEEEEEVDDREEQEKYKRKEEKRRRREEEAEQKRITDEKRRIQQFKEKEYFEEERRKSRVEWERKNPGWNNRPDQQRLKKEQEEKEYRTKCQERLDTGLLEWKFVMHFTNNITDRYDRLLYDNIKKFFNEHINFIFEKNDLHTYTFHSDYTTMNTFLEQYIHDAFFQYRNGCRQTKHYCYTILELHPIQFTNEIIFYPYNKEKYYIVKETEYNNFIDWYNNYIKGSNVDLSEEIEKVEKANSFLYTVSEKEYLDAMNYIVSIGKEDEYGNVEINKKHFFYLG